MARGKLPASERFFDSGCRFRRLKKPPKGTHFSISVRMPADDDHDGWWWSKPKKVELSSPNDKAELLAKASEYRSELEKTATAPMTMSECVERWKKRREGLLPHTDLNGKKVEGRLKQSTLDRENTVLKHINNYMGNWVLAEISAKDITDAYATMAHDGMSMSTRARVHVKLGQLMSNAVLEEIIDSNPMDRIAPDSVPKMPQRDAARYAERKITIAEADALMAAIQSEPRNGLHAAVWLAYTMGLRRGECLGLRWSDINEQAMTVSIARQMTRSGVDTTKTYKSTRTLPLTAPVWRYLASWRDEQIVMYSKPLPVRGERGRKVGERTVRWTPDVYVCTNADGSEWRPNGDFNRGLRNFFVRHKLGEWIVDDEGKRHYHGCTAHSLRHAYATCLIRDGVDIISAKALLGHAQVTTTLQIYADATADGMLEAAMAHAMHVATEEDAGVTTPEDITAFEEWVASEEQIV